MKRILSSFPLTPPPTLSPPDELHRLPVGGSTSTRLLDRIKSFIIRFQPPPSPVCSFFFFFLTFHHLFLLLLLLLRLLLLRFVPAGSSSRGGDVTVYVWHKTYRACTLVFILFLCTFSSLWLFQLDSVNRTLWLFQLDSVNRSEYCFACFAYSQKVCLSYVCPPGSFNFIYNMALSAGFRLYGSFHGLLPITLRFFFSLCSTGPLCASLILSIIYLFMKVSFSPDIIPSGW